MNLLQEDLVLLCGIARTYLGIIERLERNPNFDILEKLPMDLIFLYQNY